MSTLLSLTTELATLATQVRQELAGIKESADTTGLSTVMGRFCRDAAKQTPLELSRTIQEDSVFMRSLGDMEDSDKKEVARHVRRLMDSYAEKVADGTYATMLTEFDARCATPTHVKAVCAEKSLESFIAKIEDLRAQTARLATTSARTDASNLAAEKYATDLKFVTTTAKKLEAYDRLVEVLTEEIGTVMFSGEDDAASKASIKQLSRESLMKERKFVEKSMLNYFEAGSAQQRGDAKVTLKDLKIPGEIEKGKGVELIQSVKAFLKNRANSYYAILPDLNRIMQESQVGNYYKPADKNTGFTSVPEEIRESYQLQAKELYEEISLKVPARIMNNIRVSFKYGMEDKKAVCDIGDGPMALFCLLALYRPAGLAYRDQIRQDIESAVVKFKDGTNPLAKIKEMRSTLLEAADLNVKILWRTTGKGIVTVLSERGNGFAQELAKYNAVGAIVDPDDAIVELNRLFTDIEDCVVKMQDAGVDVKRVMQIRVMSTERRGADTVKEAKKCWYNEECTKEGCTFAHDSKPDSKLSGKGKGKGKGKGAGKGSGKGSGKGKGKGKGDDANSNKSVCGAKGCTAPSRGWPLCNSCRREGLEKGNITLKDGSKMPVAAKAKSVNSVEARLEMLEKHANATNNDHDGEDDDDDQGLFVGGGAPKCEQKKKRSINLTIKERLGKSAKMEVTDSPNRKGANDQEIEEEFNQE